MLIFPASYNRESIEQEMILGSPWQHRTTLSSWEQLIISGSYTLHTEHQSYLHLQIFVTDVSGKQAFRGTYSSQSS